MSFLLSSLFPPFSPSYPSWFLLSTPPPLSIPSSVLLFSISCSSAPAPSSHLSPPLAGQTLLSTPSPVTRMNGENSKRMNKAERN
jgi:hypothetical protein